MTTLTDASARRPRGGGRRRRPPRSTSSGPAQREHGDWSSQRRAGHGQDRPAATRASWPTRSRRAPAAPTRRRTSAAVEVAGPGFVNFRLHDTWLHDVLARRRRAPASTATPATTSASGTRVNVEFVSPTPPARVHAGGGRWAAYGDALCRMLERCGYDVAPRVLPERPRRADAAVRRLARGAQARASEPARGRLPGRVHHRVGGRDARRRRPARVGLRAGRSATCARRLERHGRRASTPGSASGRWSSPAPSTPPSPTCGPAASSYDADGAVVAAHHRLRRRQGPRARQVRRRAHLPAARHRLPPRQVRPRLRAADRRLGRRPPRLRAAAEGRRRRRSATTPTSSRSSLGQLVKLVRGRRAGAAVEARRRHRRALATCSTRSAPTSARLTFLLQSIDTRQTFDLDVSRARRWRTRSSTCRWPTPGSARIARVAAERGVERVAARRRRPRRCSSTSASSTCCASLSELPDVVRSAVRRPGAAQGHHVGARAGRRASTASTTTAT